MNPTPSSDKATAAFQRELRYTVLKRRDIAGALGMKDRLLLGKLCKKVHDYRKSRGKADLVCAVIESDWPEYEPTWAAIEARMSGLSAPSERIRACAEEVGELVDSWYRHRADCTDEAIAAILTKHFAPPASPGGASR